MQILAIGGPYASAPVNAPTSLSAIPTNTSVAISFTAPTNDGGAPITNYEYSFNLSSWTALSPADATSPVTISGLTQNTGYTVYLRAVNIVGSGPASAGVSFTTEGVPTGVATITSITNIAQTTLTVNYTVAAGGGAITGYELYVANQTNAWQTTTASPISVTGLAANTTYTFYVRAVNAYGAGPQSAGVNATTLRNPISATVLVVAGGGGGAGSSYPNAGGGGGGGGAIQQASTFTAGTYAVAVGGAGGGGAGSNASSGGTGGTSSINGISRSGGGGGSGVQTGGTSGNGFAGGSGSGSGGGGGGSSAVGQTGTGGNPSSPGNGGAGIDTSLRTGSNEQFAGGGGGSVANQTSIVAGRGLGVYGGGNGLQFNIGNGSAAVNYGGGGGGGCGTGTGGAGFQGIVVVRYPTSAAAGYTISGGTVTTVGADTVRTFTAGGNLVIS